MEQAPRVRHPSPMVISLVALTVGIVAVVLAALSFTHTSGLSPSSSSHSTPKPTTVTVPNVVAMNTLNAGEALRNAGLRVNVSTTTSNIAPPGTVFSQQPPPGSLLPPGSTVTLMSSLGPSTVPAPVP